MRLGHNTDRLDILGRPSAANIHCGTDGCTPATGQGNHVRVMYELDDRRLLHQVRTTEQYT